jgi:YD repeat-containing protein
MKKLNVLYLVLLASSALSAQIVAFPDSAAVVKNKVKQVRIYYKPAEGERTIQKQLQYDKAGRIVTEREGVSAYYYVYTYDSLGRRISSTQRDKEGTLVERKVTTYNADSSTQVSVFYTSDSTHAAISYTYDRHGRKITEAYDNTYGKSYVQKYTYDAAGRIESVYDSTGATHTASFRKNNLLLWQRTYDAKGALLHAYRFGYDASGRIINVSDSAAGNNPLRYEIQYPSTGAEKYTRNKKPMTAGEASNFRKEYYYLFPGAVRETDAEMPPPAIENEHHFTYDSKGNIVRDDLVQKIGSFSQSYVYEYEYEFY